MKPILKLAKNNTIDCLWPYILRILKDGPTHGYALREEIKKRFGFRPGTVTAYRVLYSMKRSGLVSETKEGRKTIYRLTPKGKDALKSSVDFYRERIRLLS